MKYRIVKLNCGPHENRHLVQSKKFLRWKTRGHSNDPIAKYYEYEHSAKDALDILIRHDINTNKSRRPPFSVVYEVNIKN